MRVVPRICIAVVLATLAGCSSSSDLGIAGSGVDGNGGEDQFLSDLDRNGFAVRSVSAGDEASCEQAQEGVGELIVEGEPGPQLYFDRKPLTQWSTAFVRVAFSDSDQTRLPTVGDLEDQLLGQDSRVSAYLNSVSYGQFELLGEFVADVTLDLPASVDGRAREWEELGTLSLDIPGFVESDYDAWAFVVVSDFGLGGSVSGLLAPEAVVVNGGPVETLCKYWASFAHVGYFAGDSAGAFQDTVNDTTAYVAVPGSDGLEVETETPLSPFERTFIHELIHTLEIQTHALSSTNGERMHNAEEVAGNGDYLWRDYGNRYDVMGTSEFSNGLTTLYRSLLGWIPEERSSTIGEPGVFDVTLEPLSSSEGIVTAEVRLPGRYFQGDPFVAASSRTENEGYVFEVWPTDDPYYWYPSLGLPGGAGGVVIQRTDGYSSALLDASPSANYQYSWGAEADIADVALKPGAEFDDGVIKVSDVVVNAGGSVSFTVELR